MSSLSSYKILRPLGGGTFGKVKCKVYTVARHLITNALVAIKMLNKSGMNSTTCYLKVKQEIKILKSFNHPNVIRLYDIIESTNSLLIVMEFLPGGELYNVIERTRLSEDQARVYFLDILSGLEYIHLKGYAHRDIKPENLMLDLNGRVKIGDFGLSNELKPGQFLKTRCGSPNYAAPEVISGEKYCGSQIDVWSLGVVLYALVARELPFDEISIPVLFSKIKTGKFKHQHAFSDFLTDLIARMLCVDPIARITIQQIHKHPWLTRSPYHKMNQTIAEKVVKMYNEPHLSKKALWITLNFSEFKYLNAEQAESIIKNSKESDKFHGDVDNVSTTYNIIFDIEIQNQKKIIESLKDSEKSVFKLSPAYLISEKTTAGSSYIDEEMWEKASPNNWVYGFRSNLQYCYLAINLFNSFKAADFSWKVRSNSHIFVKGKGLKAEVHIYKFEETSVIDCTLRKGCLMAFFEILDIIYNTIYKFTHIQ